MEKENFIYDDTYFYSHFEELIKNKDVYELLSRYWMEAIFYKNGLDTEASVLDYGCGLGQISAALKNVIYFETSKFAINFLKKQKKQIVALEDLPTNYFDIILSSHLLEHLPNPYELLIRFHKYIRTGGRLIIIVPIEHEQVKNLKPVLEPDYVNHHLYCWTFQTITNLLIYCDWQPIYQSKIYGPFLLKTSASFLPRNCAVKIAFHMGRIVRNYPSLLTIAKSAILEGKKN